LLNSLRSSTSDATPLNCFVNNVYKKERLPNGFPCFLVAASNMESDASIVEKGFALALLVWFTSGGLWWVWWYFKNATGGTR
jgi:hypothetical protein